MERASLPWRALLGLIGRLPQGAVSRGMGRLADLPIPRPLRPAVLGLFSGIVGIDRSEAELPLSEYGSVNSYFVRRLRPGVRSWPDDAMSAGSPVDGTCGASGTITGGRLLQAKGRWYSAAELLDDPAEASGFEGGRFLTIYLSPRDYHRIHAPLGGRITKARHIPGALLPVNLPAVLEVPDLFPRNERLIAYMDSPVGRVAVVAVGAINVGRISTAFDPAWSGMGGADRGWVTNRRDLEAMTRAYDPAIPVEKGEEIMAFHLGSTVVLLFEPGGFELSRRVEAGSTIRLGEVIGGLRGG